MTIDSNSWLLACIVIFGANCAMMHTHGETFMRLDAACRNSVLEWTSDSPALCEAIRRAGDTIPLFEAAWESRARAQDQFIAVIAIKAGATTTPAGILVANMDAKGVYGRLIEHSPSRIQSTEVCCQWEEVIDWRYRDAMHL